MPLMTRKTLLLAKVETSYGTDSGPTAASNAVEAMDVSITPLEANFVDRGLVRPWFGAKGSLLGDRHCAIEFSTELAGAGTAGAVPRWGSLLRGCSFAEVITAGTKVDYNTITDAPESITLWCYIDGLIQKISGARGAVSFDFTAGQIPKMKFSFKGLYQGPVDGAFPASPAFSGWKKPFVCNKVNTQMSLFGVNLNAKTLNIDVANDVQYRNLFNQEDITIVDRSVTGSASFEMTTVAQKNWFELAEQATTSTCNLTHGVGAGNIVGLYATDMHLISPKYSDNQGVRFLDVGLEFVPNAGNDDITVTAR